MAAATTTRDLDLTQLATEVAAAAGLEGAPVLYGRTIGTETVVRCDDPAVTQTILDNTIDVHTPAPPAPTDAEQIAALKTRLADTQAMLDTIIIDALMGEFPPA